MHLRLAHAALVVAVATSFTLAGCGGGSSDDGGPTCTPVAETCNGVDDDCDGEVDEGLTRGCYSGAPATEGVGTCGGGTQTCSAGAWGACVGEILPATDLCNGLDDDCDGAVDQDFPTVGDACSAGTGACFASGLVVCSVDGATAECDATPGIGDAEICDGIDNDCDGQTDEYLSRGCYTGPPGTEGVGTCVAGTQSCGGGTWQPCTGQTLPTPDLCNGADDDCNAATADGSAEPTYGNACDGADADLCDEGTMACVAASMVCTDTTGDAVEVCNNADDDCNGAVDDMPAAFYAQACCSSGTLADCTNTGAGTRCAAGAPVCDAGMILCAGSVAKTPEVCNGVDDDCDGVVDDLPELGASCTGDGANTTGTCTATWSCDPGNLGSGPGGLRCTQVIGPQPEVCDGVDTNCDGSLDGGVQPPPAFTCLNLGPCAGTTPTCAGVDGWTCNYTSGQVEKDVNGDVVATELLCDGHDGNCNGQVDESFPLVGQACDDGRQGICRGTGTNVCGPDRVSTQCNITTAGQTPFPEVCDGLDSDCDGATDEGLTAPVCPNQQGVCAGSRKSCGGSSGWLACDAATYEAYNPAFETSETVCFDGIDNDCDGLTDTADPNCPATWSHTVGMDGVNDFTAAERFATTSAGYTGWLTWDASHLYLGVQGPAVTSNSTTQWILVYLGAVGTGTMTGEPYGTVSPTLPFPATHYYRMRLDFGYMNIRGFNGTSWSDLPWTTEFGGVQGDFAEMNIPLGTLGSPTTLRVHVSMINEAPGAEWTWSGIPASSFTDGLDPNYGHYFEFNLAGGAAPASYAPQ
jgi:hypothetical protein